MPEVNKRYNAPHLCIMLYWRGYTNGIYTRNECCSLSLLREIFQISYLRQYENTFKICLSTGVKSIDTTNIEKFSQNEQHSP